MTGLPGGWQADTVIGTSGGKGTALTRRISTPGALVLCNGGGFVRRAHLPAMITDDREEASKV